MSFVPAPSPSVKPPAVVFIRGTAFRVEEVTTPRPCVRMCVLGSNPSPADSVVIVAYPAGKLCSCMVVSGSRKRCNHIRALEGERVQRELPEWEQELNRYIARRIAEEAGAVTTPQVNDTAAPAPQQAAGPTNDELAELVLANWQEVVSLQKQLAAANSKSRELQRQVDRLTKESPKATGQQFRSTRDAAKNAPEVYDQFTSRDLEEMALFFGQQ